MPQFPLIATEAPDLEALRGHVAGPVTLPGDPDWDAARHAWNLAVDQRPAAVVEPLTAADVQAAVRFARSCGLAVAPQGTGHNAAALGALDGVLLMRTHRMREVAVNPVNRTARVAAGTLWAEVTDAAAEHGLAPLSGSSPDVGVVGYTLGGGLSWLGRRFGLAASSVVAIELVTADGELVRADRERHPDLFWALRGGGGNFGVVTALEFRLHPVAEVYAGALMWPIERAGEVLRTWSRMLDAMPDEMATSGRLLRLPPLPDIPEPLRGGEFVVVLVAHTGDPAEGERLLAPLRALGPQIDTVASVPATALQELAMDPPMPVPAIGDGMVVDRVDGELIDALVDVAGEDSGSPLLMVELRQLGGAIGRPDPRNGALSALPGQAAVYAVGMPMEPGMATAIARHVEAVKCALDRWDVGREYLNFAERRVDARRLFDETALRRLRSIRARYDPTELFRANHPVSPAR